MQLQKEDCLDYWYTAIQSCFKSPHNVAVVFHANRMSDLLSSVLDATRLLHDLQRAAEIAESFSGLREPEAIARQTTEGLVERFGCVFARIWLMEPDQTALRLVASSGLYTQLDGSFARVPLGAYKVGKIAQNRVAFLSNHLAEEAWVKDREWAIANQIRGFAGFPLMVSNALASTLSNEAPSNKLPAEARVIGVLAIFSRSALSPEFLEVLQGLCTTVTVVLEAALHYQMQQQMTRSLPTAAALSDQIAALLGPIRLTLIGTEQRLTLPCQAVFLQAAEIVKQMGCSHCRLIYQAESVAFEAAVTAPDLSFEALGDWVRSHSGLLSLMVSCLGGVLQSQIGANHKIIQLLIKLPYPHSVLRTPLQIRCRLPVLQLAFVQLAAAAGLQVTSVDTDNPEDIPVLTDDINQLNPKQKTIWIKQGTFPIPNNICAQVDLTTRPEELKRIVEAVAQGNLLEIDAADPALPSQREREILELLVQGLRDRDVAQQLMISESTVKFHLSNVLSKLNAKTRFQALHHAIKQGWM